MTPWPPELTLSDDGAVDAPTRPVLIVALAGLFDVASVATVALDYAVPDDHSVVVGEIDPDPFYDFTVERPMIEIVDDQSRSIQWPSNFFRLMRARGQRDVVALVGVEPHLAWPTYTRCILAVVERLGVELVVTLGATADVVPHTRMPVVTGSSTDRQLAADLGLALPTYEGPTGLVGALHSDLADHGLPTISLRVGVPHYLAVSEHPRAVASLMGHLAHVVDTPLPVPDLAPSISRWDELHDMAIADDAKLGHYVEILEAEYDRRAEAALATGDDIAAHFEQILRETGDPDPDDHSDPDPDDHSDPDPGPGDLSSEG